MKNTRAQFAVALLLDLLGAAGVLLISTCTWQTIVVTRERPLADDTLAVNGRTLDAAPTALALVALAGVVAVLATRGVWRRIVGVVLVATGLLTLWRAAVDSPAVSVPRARELVADKHPQVDVTSAIAQVSTSGIWVVLTVACAVLIAMAGVLVAWRGAAWRAMGARYERPGAARRIDPEEEARTKAKANTALWRALDDGEDPTAAE